MPWILFEIARGQIGQPEVSSASGQKWKMCASKGEATITANKISGLLKNSWKYNDAKKGSCNTNCNKKLHAYVNFLINRNDMSPKQKF